MMNILRLDLETELSINLSRGNVNKAHQLLIELLTEPNLDCECRERYILLKIVTGVSALRTPLNKKSKELSEALEQPIENLEKLIVQVLKQANFDADPIRHCVLTLESRYLYWVLKDRNKDMVEDALKCLTLKALSKTYSTRSTVNHELSSISRELLVLILKDDQLREIWLLKQSEFLQTLKENTNTLESDLLAFIAVYGQGLPLTFTKEVLRSYLNWIVTHKNSLAMVGWVKNNYGHQLSNAFSDLNKILLIVAFRDNQLAELFFTQKDKLISALHIGGDALNEYLLRNIKEQQQVCTLLKLEEFLTVLYLYEAIRETEFTEALGCLDCTANEAFDQLTGISQVNQKLLISMVRERGINDHELLQQAGLLTSGKAVRETIYGVVQRLHRCAISLFLKNKTAALDYLQWLVTLENNQDAIANFIMYEPDGFYLWFDGDLTSTRHL